MLVFRLLPSHSISFMSIFVLRYQQPDLERPCQTFLYPLPPLLYLLLTGWVRVHLISRPVEGLFSLGFIGSGLIFYWLAAKRLSSRWLSVFIVTHAERVRQPTVNALDLEISFQNLIRPIHAHIQSREFDPA